MRVRWFTQLDRCCSFAELSRALDPRKDVKTDKTSIVADAIRVVTQLRAENGQLKQLNKFLEVSEGLLSSSLSARYQQPPVKVSHSWLVYRNVWARLRSRKQT